jgi:hypothetical protein
MGPNDADIIRVYTREATGEIADNTLDPNVDAQVVVELESGSAVTFSGAQWQLGIVVKDLVNDGIIPFQLSPTTQVTGNLGTPNWPTQSEQFVYTLQAGDLVLHKGNLCQIYAYLLIGVNAANYDASFVESEPFLVLP